MDVEYIVAAKAVIVISIVAMFCSLFAIFVSFLSYLVLRKMILDHIKILAKCHRPRLVSYCIYLSVNNCSLIPPPTLIYIFCFAFLWV